MFIIAEELDRTDISMSMIQAVMAHNITIRTVQSNKEITQSE
jgi:hypothetical protein